MTDAGMCGKSNFWLDGFIPAAVAWEEDYSMKFLSVEFTRGIARGVVAYQEVKY